MTAKCFHCQAELVYKDTAPGRGDSCDRCRMDVRVCYNCIHYDPKAYNECREPMAERVLDKDRRNFCDYFKLGGEGRSGEDKSKEDALKKLNDLFK